MPDAHHHISHYRATIAGGRLVLNDWTSGLAGEGPVGNLFRERAAEGVAIADVAIDHECDQGNESIVAYLADGDREAADEALIAWARRSGHRRIWLEDRVVDLGSELLPVAPVATTCSTCAMRWQERGENFWSVVAEQGRFPTFCPLCGGTLDQWETSEPEVERPRLRAVEG